MVILIISIVFFLMRILPGNPALAILGEQATPEAVETLMEKMGLKKPLYEQYIDMWMGIVQGNLGNSLRTGGPVLEEILSRLPVSLELLLGGYIIGNILAILLGAETARRGGLFDLVGRAYSTLGYCIPVFWLGMMLQIAFSVEIPIFPVQGVISPTIQLKRITGFYILDSIISGNFDALADVLAHYTLPWIVLIIWYSASNSRILRADMIEVLNRPFIITAVAKGLPDNIIVYRHALKNAIIPVLTIMGLQFATAIAGLILTETVFNIPGMGRLLYQSILNRDYPLVQGLMIFFVAIVAVVSLLIDIVLAYIDPRIRY